MFSAEVAAGAATGAAGAALAAGGVQAGAVDSPADSSGGGTHTGAAGAASARAGALTPGTASGSGMAPRRPPKINHNAIKLPSPIATQ
jgi:hypothetical protein